jgi:hypothetical protein
MTDTSYHDQMAEIMATSPSVVGILAVASIMLVAILSAAGALVSFLFTMTFFRIPEEHRKMGLGQIWLIMVPLFGVWWLHVTIRKLAASFASFFEAAQATDDAGHRLHDIQCPNGDFGVRTGLVLVITTVLAHGTVLLVYTKLPMVILTGLGIAAAVLGIVTVVYFVGVFRIRSLIPDPESEALPESYI